MPTGFADPPTTLPREQPAPTYPAEAQALGIEGRVIVKLHVGVDGRVASATVQRGVHASLDSAALAAVRTWRFTPAMADGVPVEACATLSVRFDAAPADPAVPPAGVDTAGCSVLVVPRVTRSVQPEWPDKLRMEGTEGRVATLALVDVEGRVAEVTVEEVEGDARFIPLVLAAVKRWRFTPATCDGVPFESRVPIPMRFRTEAPAVGYGVQQRRRF